MLKVKIIVVLFFVMVAVCIGYNRQYFVAKSIAETTTTINSTQDLSQNRQVANTDFETKAYSNQPVNNVFVKKSERTMYLLDANDDVVRSYHIALGDAPQGHKQQEGDERTPEGNYVLDYKNEDSIAHRSIHISYPNAQDKANAQKMGVSPGGAIMIHGQMNGYEKFTAINQQRDWTDGCVAVTNDEMDEIMDLVKVGTPIKIEW